MSFKIHLVIVSCIIVAVYIAWQFMNHTPVQPQPQAAAPVESQFSIMITHASWGLNCLNRNNNNSNALGSFQDTDSDKLREDNVLVKVSEYCNGKLKCDIPVNAQALGGDPSPNCANKELQAEYRCFSYDRPWGARTFKDTLNINCDRSAR